MKALEIKEARNLEVKGGTKPEVTKHTDNEDKEELNGIR